MIGLLLCFPAQSGGDPVASAILHSAVKPGQWAELIVVDSAAAIPAVPPVNPFHRAGSVTHARTASSAFPTISTAADGMQEYPLYGASGRGALSVPAQMTRKDFELYKKQIENSLNVIEATAVDDSPQQE